jgi:phage shock protein C
VGISAKMRLELYNIQEKGMERRLYRSQHNRIFLGVCGGIGDYFGADPVIIRVIAILITIFTGFFPGVIAYIILALIIPNENSAINTPRDNFRENVSDIRDTSINLGQEIRDSFDSKGTKVGSPPAQTNPSSRGALLVLGIIIIIAGVIIFLGNLFGWLTRFFWPSILIVAGILILILVLRRRS